MEQEPSSRPANSSRRDFVKRGVAVAAVPVLAPLAACSSTPRPEPSPAPSPAPAAAAQPVAPSATPAHANEQQRDPVSIHLTEALKARYHDRLTEEQWEEVRKGVEGNLRAAKALHDFALPIQTEPAFVFRAYRAGGR